MSDPQQPSPYEPQPPPYASGDSGQEAFPAGGYPASQPQAAAPAPRGGGVATTALILGLSAVAVSLISMVLMRVLVFSANAAAGVYGLIGGVSALVTFLIALAALACGLLGFRREQAGRGRAGIAIGIAIVLMSSQVAQLALNAATPLFYRL